MGEVPEGVSAKIGKRAEGGHRLVAEPGEDRDQRERGRVPQARSVLRRASVGVRFSTQVCKTILLFSNIAQNDKSEISSFNKP